MTLKTRDADVLKFHPFQDDFGLPSDRCFSDKIAVARKPGPCHGCAQTISAGERIRRSTWLFDGEVRTYRWCSLCCDAMASSWIDNGSALDARERLRKSNEALP